MYSLARVGAVMLREHQQPPLSGLVFHGFARLCFASAKQPPMHGFVYCGLAWLCFVNNNVVCIRLLRVEMFMLRKRQTAWIRL